MNGLTDLIPPSIHWWLLGAVLVFWFVGAYNRLVRLRSAVVAAYAALDAALVRQVEYVKARLSRAAEGDPGGAGGERAVAANAVADPRPGSAGVPAPDAANSLRAAAAQTAAMMALTRQKPLEPASIEALGTALDVLLSAWERTFPGEAVRFDAEGALSQAAPLADAPPDTATGTDGLSADRAERAASSVAWPEPSAAMEITRGQFNASVLQYNGAIGQFPAVLVAWAFRLQRAAPLL